MIEGEKSSFHSATWCITCTFISLPYGFFSSINNSNDQASNQILWLSGHNLID